MRNNFIRSALPPVAYLSLLMVLSIIPRLAFGVPAAPDSPYTPRKSSSAPSRLVATIHVKSHTAAYRSPAYAQRAQVRRMRNVRHAAFKPPPSLGRSFGLHQTPDALALRSSVAYVIDQNTNEALFEKNAQAVLPIASISKLMTAMVTLDANLPLTEILEVSNADRDFEKGTSSRLSVGSRLSRADMLHIALMSSENRAAAALSRYYPGGRLAFVTAMNQKAQSLGMKDTHFLDPTGLSSHNVSSARDLAKMVKAAYQYPVIREFSTDANHNVFTSRKALQYRSTNALVRNPSWEIGLQKTGFIREAGECLVMQATIQNRPLIIVLLDSTGKYSRLGDAKRIRSWVGNGGVQHMSRADAADS
ncbi:D-alanyl-D-alanine endopeptidase [Mycoavidus sp. B2-EB]|uniref:D-alanyl-D-alanine endopeptidase n=1 Tax=Mycoavidus sp. B2-EB TaxID=2651972 RepID=UPI0016294C90|nr:D-alanyl-D-alanine endopeptidase [Mycoavidus sp. B2-EB]BBO59606.1 D-alanyl-D-alanine endopeptidase [Mycoavidus sp. B2-EB]